MACSDPINYYTNSKYLYRGVNRFKQSYSCGCCSGCISRSRTDWRVRAYYESKDCLKDKTNFVLFDTLTYSDDNIKRYSDIFPDLVIPSVLDRFCFSRSDVQHFFKRLRINLKRAGYRFNSTELRYILSSEYGSSEYTRGFENTHRPHYHILFFVSFPISPIEFSRFVSRSWHLGKTDGVKPFEDCSDCYLRKYCKGYCLYQSNDYVLNERVVSSDSVVNCMKCVNYVTKYISKDMYVTSELKNRVDTLWRYLHPDYRDNLLLYRKYRVFCNQVLPFHLQSIGFGASVLRDVEEKKFIVEKNLIHIPSTSCDVDKVVAVPRYYQRKLYYDYFKDSDGRVKWFLTDYGVDVKVNQLDNKIKDFMQDYRSIVDDYISDSDLFQLALYKLVYRGTLSDYRSLYLPYKEYYRNMIKPKFNEEPLYYNLNTFVDKRTIGSFLSTRYVISSDGEIIYKGKQLHKEFIPYDGYVIVSDKLIPFWHGFEHKLLSYELQRLRIVRSNDVVMLTDDKHKFYYKEIGLLKA